MHPSLKFVFIFIATYIGFNLAYTLYLSAYPNQADPLTNFTAQALKYCFTNASTIQLPNSPRIQFLLNQKAMVNIMEGCNGLSVFLTLISFFIAYKGPRKQYLIYIPVAAISMFAANLLRLYLLVVIRRDYSQYFVFTHEYLFPTVLYIFAFFFMVAWVQTVKKTSHE